MIKNKVKYIHINNRRLKIIILDSREDDSLSPCIMWIHGGGYSIGMPEMVYASRVKDLLKDNSLVVISPRYRLSISAPYPAALEDCYSILKYIYDNAKSLGVDKNKIMVGGESAGGGLALAVAIYARDKKEVPIKYVFPLYPMIDSSDTESSKDNHGHIWNTKKNHRAWKRYLKDLYGSDNVPCYASPAKLKDFSGLPPFYTFVGDKEPFYSETVEFTRKAKKAGIDCKCDIYETDTHAFDIYLGYTEEGKRAREAFIENYEYVKEKYLDN